MQLLVNGAPVVSKIICLLLVISCLSVDLKAMEKEQITLISSDNQEIKIERKQAKKSATLKGLIQDCAKETIPLALGACKKAVLEQFFCLIDMPDNAIKSSLEEKSVSFIVQLCESANYLDIDNKQIISACIDFLVNRIIAERDSESLKKYLEALKEVSLDMQRLVRQEFLQKNARALGVMFKRTKYLKEREEPEINKSGSYTIAHWRDGWFQDSYIGDVIKLLKNPNYTIIAHSLNNSDARVLLEPNEFRLLNLETGHARKFVNGGNVRCLFAVNATGKFAIGNAKSGDVCLSEIETGKSIVLKGHTADILVVALSLDNKYAITGDHDGIMRYWDLETAQIIKVLHGHTGAILSVAFSADGNYALSGSSGDNSALLWNLQAGIAIRRLKGDNCYISTVVMSPDGMRAMTGGIGGGTYLWNLDSGKIMGKYSTSRRVAMSPNGKYALSLYDNMVTLLNLENSQAEEIFEVFGHETAIRQTEAALPLGLGPEVIKWVAFGNTHNYVLIGLENKIYYLYLGLFPEDLQQVSLSELFVIAKLNEQPSLLKDNYYRQIINNLDPKIQKHFDHVLAQEKSKQLKKAACIIAPFALAAFSYGCYRLLCSGSAVTNKQ